MVMGLIVLAAAYLVIFRPLRNKRRSDPMNDGPSRTMFAQQRHVEREMENLLVELSEMARKITAQIDTRATKLEVLIQEAEAKIEQLRALSSAMPQTPSDRYRADAEASLPGLSSSPGEPADPRHAEIYSLADQGQTSAQIAQGLNRPRGEVELILALRGK
jgi:type II secretory pathway component PulM